jgi:hypothetical protein
VGASRRRICAYSRKSPAHHQGVMMTHDRGRALLCYLGIRHAREAAINHSCSCAGQLPGRCSSGSASGARDQGARMRSHLNARLAAAQLSAGMRPSVVSTKHAGYVQGPARSQPSRTGQNGYDCRPEAQRCAGQFVKRQKRLRQLQELFSYMLPGQLHKVL